MTYRFSYIPQSRETEIRIVGPSGPLPADSWALEAPDALLPGLDILKRLEASGVAVAADELMLIENAAIAGLSAKEGASIGLPPLAPAVAYVNTRGVITRSDFVADLEWRRPNGQPIVAARRVGAFLSVGEEWSRVPDALFAIAEAVDALNQSGENEAQRFASLAALREALPPAEEAGAAHATGLAATLTIAVADAFSLDLEGEGETAQLVPILHRAGGNPNEAVLSKTAQHAFGTRHFNAFGAARPVYALGGGTYVVLSAPLRRALEVVRRTQSKPFVAKRALMASPRATLRDALGEEIDEILLEGVFRETAAYSERVVGLGLWQKRVLPWIALSGTDWLGDGQAGNARSALEGGLLVGDRRVSLSQEEAEELSAHIERAIGAGKPNVPITIGGEIINVPAVQDTLAALQQLEAERTRQSAEAKGSIRARSPETHEVLLIRPNEEEVELEGMFRPRPALEALPPTCITSILKSHQKEGLAWLQAAYSMGRPGVLLADDMGLGKTLQGLAFLAWLREGMQAGVISQGPVAVVAPTGLLQNWMAEETRHLARPGLGRCLEAFGKGLGALKQQGPDGRPSLNIASIQSADWVLTTYETLRDYDRDFGSVRFAAMLFDEAQKIKTPGVRLTDAAKAMHVDFRIALTGTPVENRLADLWCITDAIHPAFLGDLKTFSLNYERAPDPDRLRTLKETLDKSHGGRPPILLRRLKVDRLPDLPVPDERSVRIPMPATQREAYEEAIKEASARRGELGFVLRALQRLRAVSLHPDPQLSGNDGDFIAASARCIGAFQALDTIAEANEKALIFVDDLTFQARLAGVLQRRYAMKAPPAIINGSVDGHGRQSRVDRFQSAPPGFDVMVLSPRAGGVGLTLTAANHVVHLSRWWNPAVEDQCTGRVLRIGQTRPVLVHFPFAIVDEHPSFDLNLDALIRKKRRLFHDAFMPPELTVEDRNELFRTTVG